MGMTGWQVGGEVVCRAGVREVNAVSCVGLLAGRRLIDTFMSNSIRQMTVAAEIGLVPPQSHKVHTPMRSRGLFEVEASLNRP